MIFIGPIQIFGSSFKLIADWADAIGRSVDTVGPLGVVPLPTADNQEDQPDDSQPDEDNHTGNDDC